MRTVRAATVGVVCALLLVLSGCVKVDLDLEVHSDNTVSGTMILGLSQQLPNAEQAVEQLKSQLPPGATSEPWSDSEYVGVRISYDRVPIDEFSTPSVEGAGDTGLGLRREGDFFILGSPEDTAPDGPDLSGIDAVYRVRLTFPGPVVEGNGTIDGRSIEWTDMGVSPYAKARASSAVLVPVLIAVGVVLVLAAAALLVFLMMRRQRAAQPAAAGTTTTAAHGWSGQPGAPDGGHDPTHFTGATVDRPGAWGSGSAAGVPTPPGWDPAGQQSQPPQSYPPAGPTGSPWDQQQPSQPQPSPQPPADDPWDGGDDRESPWQRPR